MATSCEELTHGKRLWCWEGLGAGGEGGDRGWDGWMASPTRWTWVWVNPGVGDGQGGLACCNSWGRKESDMTEWLNWTELNWVISHVEHLFLCLLAICMSSLEKHLFSSFAYCLIKLFGDFVVVDLYEFFVLLLNQIVLVFCCCWVVGIIYIYVSHIWFANSVSHAIASLLFCFWFPLQCRSF